MLFKSKFAAEVVFVRSRIEVPHPTLPKILNTIPALRADFAIHGAEQTIDGPEGQPIRVGDIRGHYFDSVAAQELNGWTDDERDEVERALLAFAKRQPERIQLVSEPKIGEPLPNYKKLSAKRVIALASELGVVGECLAYEKQEPDLRRPDALEPLEKKLADAAASADVEDALTAA